MNIYVYTHIFIYAIHHRAWLSDPALGRPDKPSRKLTKRGNPNQRWSPLTWIETPLASVANLPNAPEPEKSPRTNGKKLHQEGQKGRTTQIEFRWSTVQENGRSNRIRTTGSRTTWTIFDHEVSLTHSVGQSDPWPRHSTLCSNIPGCSVSTCNQN